MPQALARAPMNDVEWQKLTPADWPELRKSPRPIIAQWVSGQSELNLYEDGSFDAIGLPPVELMQHVHGAWLEWLRGRIA